MAGYFFSELELDEEGAGVDVAGAEGAGVALDAPLVLVEWESDLLAEPEDVLAESPEDFGLALP